jgi:hypothetical protein
MTDSINYLGESLPVKVGYYAVKHTNREIKEKTGTDLSMEGLLSGDIEVMEPLLYHSLAMGFRLEKRVFDIPREDTEFILDVCFFDFLKLVQKFKPEEALLGKSEGEAEKEQ